VTPSQHFTSDGGFGDVVGTVRATDADGDPLGNWQIVGGSGVGTFTIDPDTGQIRTMRRDRDEPGRRTTHTLTVVVDDRKLTSRPEVVTIDVRHR
jgi:hypothetical protein